MTASKSEQRQLQLIADELLADESIASLVALFHGQPLPARRGRILNDPRRPQWRRRVQWRGDPRTACPLAGGHLRSPGGSHSRTSDGHAVFLVGVVLIVPAFLLFARPGQPGRLR